MRLTPSPRFDFREYSSVITLLFFDLVLHLNLISTRFRILCFLISRNFKFEQNFEFNVSKMGTNHIESKKAEVVGMCMS